MLKLPNIIPSNPTPPYHFWGRGRGGIGEERERDKGRPLYNILSPNPYGRPDTQGNPTIFGLFGKN